MQTKQLDIVVQTKILSSAKSKVCTELFIVLILVSPMNPLPVLSILAA